MAKETKVGLLVGLAFIVCFAIILANKGRQDHIASQLPYSLLVNPDSQSTERLASTGGSTAAPGTPRRATLQPSSFPQWTTSSVAQRPQADPARDQLRGGRRGFSGQREVEDPGSYQLRETLDHRREGQRNTSQPRREINVSERKAPSENAMDDRQVVSGRSSNALGDRSDFEPIPQTTTSDDAARAAKLQELLDRSRKHEASKQNTSVPDSPRTHPVQLTGVARGGEDSRRGDSSDRTNPVEEATLRSKKYVVQPGDTLSAIAHAAYNTRSQTVIEEIYRANRTTMADVNTLVVGAELVLPVVKDYQGPMVGASAASSRLERPSASGSAGASSDLASASASAGAGFRWYQVKKGDGYSKIAREQLGDPAAWKAIHDLNKDKFPDPDRIREGVRIKLPLK